MLAALSFASVLAISLASYVAVTYSTMERVDERVTAASKLLAGENVLEETLHRVSTSNLVGWTLDGTSASRTVTGIDLNQLAESLPINFTETVSVQTVQSPPPGEAAEVNPDQVELTLTGIDGDSGQRTLSLTQRTELENGSVETRTLTATMSPISPFQVAIAADRTIWLRRNGVVNSYDSRIGTYGGENTGYEAVLAGNYVSINRAQISGYAASAQRSPYFGRRASLRGPESDDQVSVDQSRIVPTPYRPNLDAEQSSGIGSLFGGPNSTLGTSGSSETRLYYASNINLRNHESIVIDGPTHLIVDGDIDLQDDAAIVVNLTGTLEIHVDGNVSLRGRGIINLSEVPANVAIIGTNSDRRSITFRGNEPMHSAIFAPNSDFYVYGNNTTRTLFGAIVARSVTFDDATNFHFDVALRDTHFDGVETAYAFDPKE